MISQSDLGQYLPVYKECVVFSGIAGPFHQSDPVPHNLQAGDAAGMDAAACVEIGGVRTEPGPVRVSRDQNMSAFPGVVGETLLHRILMGVVFGGAGGVKHPEMLQRLPEVPHQKSRQPPESGVEGVRLVSVGQVKALSLPPLLQDDTFIKGEAREKGLMALGIRTEIRAADLVGIARSFFLHVVVAIQQIKPPLAVKQGEEPENIAVDLNNLAHPPVLPQFISVPQFNIGVSLGIIML